jgi:hypothetical protein
MFSVLKGDNTSKDMSKIEFARGNNLIFLLLLYNKLSGAVKVLCAPLCDQEG